MTIKVQCPSCSKRYAVKKRLNGRKIRCVDCSAVISIPITDSNEKQTSDSRSQSQQDKFAASASGEKSKASRRTAAPSGAEPRKALRSDAGAKPVARRRRTRAEASSRKNGAASIPTDSEARQRWLSTAFQSNEIEPIAPTWSYRFAVFLVAILMIALPVIYIGLIGAIVVATWFLVSAIMSTAGPALGGALSAFVVLTAIAIVLFMLKPLFGKPPHTNGRRTVEREDEPLLFDFVEHICDIVDAPRPAEIEIDCTINAAASFNRGVLSLLGGDLRLTIGISMVAGLNVRQFAGVLAHEFGHFSQGTGMRFSYLIRSISFWFTRVVYERDAWDEKLYRLSEHENPVLRLVLSLTRFGIWLTRRVLWVLMLAGHAVSGFLLRQMEFDADRYESRVAGCKSFSTTSRRMSVLNVAHGGALDDLQQFHEEGRLADDLPQLIVLNVKEIPRKILKQLKKQEEEASTGLFDTHPCHRDRVENAMQDGSEGIIVADHPAEQLFQKFGVRSRSVTLDFYTEIFGGKFKKKLVRPLSELVELRKVQQASMLALRRFFQGHFSWYRSVPLPQEIWTPLDGQTKAVFLQNRQEVLNVAPKYNKAWRKYNKAEGQLIEAKLARTLIDADFSIRPSSFSIPLTSRGQIRQAIEKIGVRQGKSEPILSAFETAAAERMCLTLQTARSPDVAAQLKKRGFRQSELDELLQIHIHLNDSIYQLVEIHDQQMILGKLMQLVADGYRHDAVIGGIHSQMEFLIEKISSLHSSFLQTPYPFDHARAGITLAEFMLKTRKLPTFSDPVELYNAAENVGSALPMIQTRVLGRLCEFSEAVETIFGLTPLDDPPEDDDDENDER